MFNTVTIVGVGLISGSFSLALKERALVKKVIGVSRTEASARKAIDLGLIDEALPLEERFEARLKLAELPRNSSKTRIRNRCQITGRPRAYYRKLKMSRIALRELGAAGHIPGLVKSSW